MESKNIILKRCLICEMPVQMKNYLFILLLFLASYSNAEPWKLIWSDEFNYTGLLDSTKWIHEFGNIRNSELQQYTFRKLENSKVENGNLQIIALKNNTDSTNYTSARLSTDTKFSFMYGKIEARIKTPTGQGIWPAFWLLGQNIADVGSPKCGEIDILEHVNNETVIHSTMHWDNNGLVSFESKKTCDVQQFHTYAVEWDKDKITWFLDGKKYFGGKINGKKQNSDEFRHPFYIIFNLAVGGNWPGKPDNTTIFPATMYVDYVRVYQKK